MQAQSGKLESETGVPRRISGRRVTVSLAAVVVMGLATAAMFWGDHPRVRDALAMTPGGAHTSIDWSERAKPGVPYRFELHTHCGLRYARFDGIWWGANHATDSRTGWGNPSTYGTMELTGSGQALFLSDSGRRADFGPLPADRQIGNFPARLSDTGLELDICQ